ncbi:MliC family protein [Ruegeria lacuscaerulensis]|uniref:MliC family protein n=1 Tax=Ruegeria lacuscaerulensis TaxID=55218 RepID=UPI00147A6835|nr:MliC family protein [Ruegeria lacuscaerulensis]
MKFFPATALASMLGMWGSVASAQIDVLPVTFTCENGTPLEVIFFNATDGASAAAMLVDNRLIALEQTISGSGIQYRSSGPGGSYVLRSKGWDATVSYLAAGDAASEQVVLSDCSSR